MTDIELRGGDLLGRYELLLPIAKGGMATVWLARLSGTRGFRKIVAVKTILRGAIDDARMEQMFIEEATLAAQIHHPNVVGILDFGEHSGTLFLAMEWVEGEPINAIVAEAAKRGGLPMSVAINVIGQACKGLHAAHELRDEAGGLLGVVHRDISPQNIIVSYTGTAKVLDFGIAKATAKSSTLTEAGEVKGKFAFMAPEQLYGRPVDRRADIFSLGVLAYMLTTGRHPFRGDNMGETVRNICSSDRPPPRPNMLVSEYPAALEAVLLKAMAKSPADRYQTAHDFLSALERAVPECLENSFEVELSSYMNELFGARLAERRRQLRLAEERSGREELSVTGVSGTSNSSLGAVAIDGMRTGVSQPAVPAPISDRASDSGAISAPPDVSRKRRLMVAAPVGALVLASLFVLGRGLLVPPVGAPPVAAGAASVLDGAPPSAPAAPASIAPARSLPTVTDGTPLTVESAKGPATAESPPARGSRRAVPIALPRQSPAKAGAPAASTPPPAAAGEKPAAPAAPASAPPTPARGNSWDPSTFGGRY